MGKFALEALLKMMFSDAISLAMNQIMDSIGFIQLLVFMPLVAVTFPASAIIINGKLIEIATFDVYRTEELFPKILEF